MKEAIGVILRIGIPLVGIALVFLPLWYVGWRVKQKTWWHFVGAVVGMGGVFLIINVILNWFDSVIRDNVLDSHSILDGILYGGLYYIFLTIVIVTISPFIFVKRLYGQFTFNSFLTSFAIAALLFIVQVVIYAYSIAAGLGQAGAKYF